MIDVAAARRHFRYDPATGLLFWVSRIGVTAGREAGTPGPDGYKRVGFQRRGHLVHRLIWAMHNDGDVPEYLDHINGVKDDNRLENLRPATKSENGMNRTKQRNNATGYKGVCFDTSKGRFLATIKRRGEQHRLGHHKTAEAAHAAYVKAAEDLHGQFARTE